MRFVTAGSNALRSNAFARHDGLCLQLDAERGSMEAGRQLASILRPLGPKKTRRRMGIVCLSSKHSRVVKIKFHNRSPKVAELGTQTLIHLRQRLCPPRDKSPPLANCNRGQFCNRGCPLPSHCTRLPTISAKPLLPKRCQSDERPTFLPFFLRKRGVRQ